MVSKNNPVPVVRPGATFIATGNMPANTAAVVFLPAANVNGAIIWSASHLSNNATGPSSAALLAKSSAPASVSDGTPIAISKNAAYGATNFCCCIDLLYPTFVPAGLGLYFIVTVVETLGLRQVQYTLL